VRLLVGTKGDLKEERAVSEADIASFSERYNMKYIETSAKLNSNVAVAF
jgi:GTPase SAR1 family protein